MCTTASVGRLADQCAFAFRATADIGLMFRPVTILAVVAANFLKCSVLR